MEKSNATATELQDYITPEDDRCLIPVSVSGSLGIYKIACNVFGQYFVMF